MEPENPGVKVARRRRILPAHEGEVYVGMDVTGSINYFGSADGKFVAALGLVRRSCSQSATVRQIRAGESALA